MNKLPAVFNKYFAENESIHCHNTREKHDFHSFTANSEVEKSIKHNNLLS